jgi:hypothetical protein
MDFGSYWGNREFVVKNLIISMVTAICLAATVAVGQNFPTTANPRLVTTSVPNTAYANMGLAFLSDGRMLILGAATSTSPGNGSMGQGYITPADGNQAIYLVSGLSAKGSLTGVTVTKILDSLTGPPPGIVVVNDTVYVQDRTAFYRVKSLNPTGGTAKSKNAVRIIKAPTLDSNFVWLRGESGHQYVFTPQYHNGRFYANYSGSIISGGTSNAPPTSTFSGALLSWSKDSIIPDNAPANAGFRKDAGGLRSPNGLATNGQYMLYADNQGSFTPGNPIRLFKPGQPLVTYGTRQSTTANAAGTTGITNTKRNWAEDLPYQPPAIWIPYSPFASMSQPLYLDRGPYRGDWIVGDVNAAGMGRLHLEDVDNSGNYQASFHLFSGSSINAIGATEGKAINRLIMSPDSAIYVGTVLKIGNWPSGSAGPVFRVTFKDTALFEILAVRSRKNAAGTANGVEVFFSQPVNPSTVTTSSFALQQTNYSLGAFYGCNGVTCATKTATVTAVSLSADNRKAFLTIATPDTSIGAAHIGTIGVGNNGTGVWGGPGKQDRTLRVTLTGVTSATGSPLFYNVAWLGWHFQSTKAFDPANTDLTPSPIARLKAERLASAITVRSLPGLLTVQVDQPGRVTVSVYGMNGALEQQRTGEGSIEFDTHAFGPGLHVLRVKQAGTVYSRTVTF